MFIFFAAVAFIGFIINAMFYKFKISSVLPLMVLGAVVGPVLHLVNIGNGSFLLLATPYISAIAIAFILFDVGLNMKISKLGDVIAIATKFTFVNAVVTGILISIAGYFIFGWTLLEAFAFGFALSGTSTMIVPTLMKLVSARAELKTVLLYEGIATDMLQLIVPLILLGFIVNPVNSTLQIGSFIFTEIFGSILLGIVSAFFWLYILNRYKEQGMSYSWMLTLTMVVAAYGIAEWMGISGAITVFVFGLAFANMGAYAQKSKDGFWKSISIGNQVKHIRNYQREIVFFASTFFFVYIGVLLNLKNITFGTVLATVIIVVLIFLVRYIFSPMLRKYFSADEAKRRAEERLVFSNISRGLSPAIIATVPLSLGILIPGFLDTIFLVILFTNIVSTIGVMFSYKGVRYKRG